MSVLPYLQTVDSNLLEHSQHFLLLLVQHHRNHYQKAQSTPVTA
jgi:hypothetical protein